MKKIFILCVFAGSYVSTHAQVPTQDAYQNVPSAAININKYNFYIDSITATNEQPVTFAATANNISAVQPINVVGTVSGVHQLYAKVINANGNPSIINLGNFYMEGDNKYQNIPATAININKYSFYIDSIKSTNEQPLTFAATANNTSPAQPVNIAGTVSGVHQLYAKVTNTNGSPSIINFGNFYMEGDNKYQNTPVSASDVNKYSFYIDSITATNEQPVTFAATPNNISTVQPVSIAGTISGVHQLYAKVTNINGSPSIINLGNFYMEGDNKYQNTATAADNITRYEFYIDSIKTTNVQSLNFTAAASNTTSNNAIDLTSVLPGVHQLYARVFDVNNKQSIVNLGNFTMDQIFRYSNINAAAPAVSAMEYYVDVDPGFGAATPVSFTAANDINNLAIAATGAWLTTSGAHTFYIRSKQNPWSINAAVPFSVTGTVPLTWRYIMAQLQDKTGIIKWGTATEINTKEFVVEHCTDGRAFIPLDVQAASGNSSTAKDYLYHHSNLPAGLNYYRIKQTDNDGRFTYSAIVTLLNKDGLRHALLAPNPASNYTLLILSKPTDKTTISIYNTSAQLVKTITVADGQLQQQIDVSALPKGQYSLRLVSATEKQTLLLMKL